MAEDDAVESSMVHERTESLEAQPRRIHLSEDFEIVRGARNPHHDFRHLHPRKLLVLLVDYPRVPGFGRCAACVHADFYDGKPVVLEFWATWCPLCKKMEPTIEDARQRYGDRVTFVSVGVTANQTADRQREYADKQHLSGKFVFDADGAAVRAFSVPHTSYIVVIDKSRRVVYTGVGTDQDIEAAIKKAGI
jgi:thiol-disulfide isomerase/thioredoxin